MWLEAMYASMSVAGVCGSVLAVNFLFPAETKRFLRFLKAELNDRIPALQKRPTIELALHASIDVDMKWWDEEFAKINRAIPDSTWAAMVADRVRDYSISPPTPQELNRWAAGGITSITDGSVTYSVPQARVSARERVALTDQKVRILQSIATRDGVENVPEREMEALKSQLLMARDQASLQRINNEITVAARHYTSVLSQCPDCEYVEHRTYTDKYAIMHRTALCRKCEMDMIDETVVKRAREEMAKHLMARQMFGLAN